MYKKIRIMALLLCFVTPSFSCVSISPVGSEANGKQTTAQPQDENKRVKERIEEFHKLYNEKKFAEIVDNLYDPSVFKVQEKKQIIDELQSNYETYGKVENGNLTETKTFQKPGYQEIRIEYRTRFEKKTIIEWFVIFLDNDQAKIAFYAIQEDAGNTVKQ